MTVLELKAKRDAGETPIVLDVREAAELVHEPYPFPVVHIPMGELPSRLDELPRGAEIVCACHSGGRSTSVVGFLRRQGFNAVNLDGGFVAWARDVGLGTPQY
jgi:rhodanese-related sulfurtransferase